MKAVILAGGLGTRLSEETHLRPKPMIEIGDRPILWHIMKLYSFYGINDFIICCGYKGYVIKEYFFNYSLHLSDITFHLNENTMDIHQKYVEPWKVTLVNTGEHTLTGGRLKRIQSYLSPNEDFCFTYGDGVGDINISNIIKYHKSSQKLATVTAALPPGRFGSLSLSENLVTSFQEKPQGDGAWINAGFFVLSPKVIDFIADDQTIWEHEPMEILTRQEQLQAYIHKGFWQPMDTLRDKIYLENLWKTGKAPWKVW